MIRDFRIENHLFSPHLRNGSYETFFEQSTQYKIDPSNTPAVASSLWHIDTIQITHPVLELESQVSRVLALMEVHGVYIDREVLENLEQELTKTIAGIEAKVQKQIQQSEH